MQRLRLSISIALVALVACSHTVDGTAADVDPNDGGSATGATCPSVGGTWEIKSTVRGDCPAMTCAIVQSGCSLTLGCASGASYQGTLSGGSVAWHDGKQSCTGTLGPAGARIDGTCSGGDVVSCTLLATRL